MSSTKKSRRGDQTATGEGVESMAVGSRPGTPFASGAGKASGADVFKGCAWGDSR